jgi:hypothetical protein
VRTGAGNGSTSTAAPRPLQWRRRASCLPARRRGSHRSRRSCMQGQFR